LTETHERTQTEKCLHFNLLKWHIHLQNKWDPKQANRNKMKIFSSCVRPKNTEKVNKRQQKIMQANII